MREMVTIRGIFWTSGDHIYVDYDNLAGEEDTLCLDDLMKNSIPDGTMVELEIAVIKPERSI